MELYNKLKTNFFIISGPNVIENPVDCFNTAKKIKEILYKAIKNGTGFRAKVNDHDVFGKTGTARIFKNEKYNEDLHNALFIGMTKIEDKEYLVGLFVKNPKINGDGGGDVAAPIFSEIIETIQKL